MHYFDCCGRIQNVIATNLHTYDCADYQTFKKVGIYSWHATMLCTKVHNSEGSGQFRTRAKVKDTATLPYGLQNLHSNMPYRIGVSYSNRSKLQAEKCNRLESIFFGYGAQREILTSFSLISFVEKNGTNNFVMSF